MTPDLRRPVVGISVNLEDGQYRSRSEYSKAVWEAGGVPVHLTCHIESIPHYLELCDAFVTTGGDDPDTTDFGSPPHPKATLIDPIRQDFELALLESLSATDHPLLAICLGMQLFSLVHGGTLEQYLPDVLESAGDHWGGRSHCISGIIGEGVVHSHHKQAMSSAGSLEIIGRSQDGLIEAVREVGRPTRVGVQWHPERTAEHRLGQGLFEALVRSVSTAGA